MNGKVISIIGAAIVAIAAVVIIAVAASGGEQEAASPAPAPSVKVTSANDEPCIENCPVKESESAKVVTIKDGKTDPSSLTIKVGETVTFKNEGKSAIELDSDPHPQHTSFRAFNNHTVAPGQSFQFQFREAMTLHYHDHLNPSVKGTIIVQ